MFILNWFWDTLSSFGLCNKRAKILLIGIDNAGKSTLLHMLKYDKLKVVLPTIYPKSEFLVMDKVTFSTFDMAGHLPARRLWKEYFLEVNGIVYLVDSFDRERLAESKAELDALLSTKELAKVPFLILGNKIDFIDAASEEELRAHLGLHYTTGKGIDEPSTSRPIELFMCSVAERRGYQEGFRWISQYT